MSRRILHGAALACALSASPIADALANDCCPVVELRQYTLHPGKRDELIGLFEQRFIESQEATGMRIAATFRDLGDPDRFVWVRGFADMQARHDALTAFYYGPVWQAHREQANATLADNDNVLLLRPAFAGSGFALDGLVRPAPGATAGGRREAGGRHHLLSAGGHAARLRRRVQARHGAAAGTQRRAHPRAVCVGEKPEYLRTFAGAGKGIRLRQLCRLRRCGWLCQTPAGACGG
jgi:quinol monooxygenase YgiN